MNVTTKRKTDLQKPNQTLYMDAVQGDANSRYLELSLYSGAVPWMIPESITAAVRYCKPDQTRGYYDTLPEGKTCWQVQENRLTVALAPQMLTVSGTVQAQVEMTLDTTILSTFSIKIHVEENPADGIPSSEDYVNWLQWIKDQTAEHTQIVAQAAETAQTAADSAGIYASESLAAAQTAQNASTKAVDAAASATAIVAGNEAYTKLESDRKYSSSIVPTAKGMNVILNDSAEMPLQKLRICGKTLQTGTPALNNPAEPKNLGNTGAVRVTICGRNLLDPEAVTSHYYTSNGVMTANSFFALFDWIPVKQGDILSFYAKYIGSTEELLRWAFFDTNKNFLSRHTSPAAKAENAVITATANGFLRVFLNTSNYNTATAQLTYGAAASAFEPFCGRQLSVSIPNGLPGIAVTSGGNYTDENGQQWICDEINFAERKYVRRIGEITFDGSDDEVWQPATTANGSARFITAVPGICPTDAASVSNLLNSHFTVSTANNIYSASLEACAVNQQNLIIHAAQIQSTEALRAFLANDPMKVVYVLATPIETVLTAEILDAYAALHTNYPNTTVFNDTGAGMEVKYVADTKLYIDHKFTELAAAIVSNT